MFDAGGDCKLVERSFDSDVCFVYCTGCTRMLINVCFFNTSSMLSMFFIISRIMGALEFRRKILKGI